LKMACIFKIYLPLEFLSYRVMAYLYRNLWTGAKKVSSQILIFWVGIKILRSECAGTHVIFLEGGGGI
jgi:hypothetical protein